MADLPRMDNRQFRRAKRLICRLCANYDNGNCLPLDDGDSCPCPQLMTQVLICKYFRAAVLPLDRELETALLYKNKSKRCCQCGTLFRPGSNRGKYCPDCAAAVHRQQKAESERRRRAERGQLGA